MARRLSASERRQSWNFRERVIPDRQTESDCRSSCSCPFSRGLGGRSCSAPGPGSWDNGGAGAIPSMPPEMGENPRSQTSWTDSRARGARAALRPDGGTTPAPPGPGRRQAAPRRAGRAFVSIVSPQPRFYFKNSSTTSSMPGFSQVRSKRRSLPRRAASRRGTGTPVASFS